MICIMLWFSFTPQEFLDRRKMTEFGSLALVDEGAGDGDGVHISLPGVRRGMMLASALSDKKESFYLIVCDQSCDFAACAHCSLLLRRHELPTLQARDPSQFAKVLPHWLVPNYD